MSEGETKFVDTSGDYLYAVRDGDPVEEPRWRSSRVVVTDKRVVLAGNGSNQSIPHGKVELVADPDEIAPADVVTDGTTALRVGDSALLLDASDVDDFVKEYCRAALDKEVILVKQPAVVGGVVQDTEWSKARFRLADDVVKLALPGGETTSFPIEEISTVETADQTVTGQERTVVQIEHTDEDDRSVETHFSGTPAHAHALERLFATITEDRGNEDRELTEAENQVLMALYSGVSPFEMSDFVGMDVDEVEEIYQNLLEMDAVDKVRERTEVTLNAHGRNLASEAMSDQ